MRRAAGRPGRTPRVRPAEKPRNSGGLAKARLLERGFAVLLAVAASRRGTRLAHVTRQTSLPQATVLRILRTLEDIDVITFDDETRLYTLGPTMSRLGTLAQDTNDVVRVGQPYLERLHDATGETACLFQERHGHRVCVASAISGHDLGMRIAPGQVRELMAGGPGRVLVAYRNEREKRQFTRGWTPAQRRALRDEWERLYATRVVVTRDEIVMGATAIATPVFDHLGQVDTSLAVIGPTVRLPAPRVDELVGTVITAGVEISRRRGWKAELSAHGLSRRV